MSVGKSQRELRVGDLELRLGSLLAWCQADKEGEAHPRIVPGVFEGWGAGQEGLLGAGSSSWLRLTGA